MPRKPKPTGFPLRYIREAKRGNAEIFTMHFPEMNTNEYKIQLLDMGAEFEQNFELQKNNSNEPPLVCSRWNVVRSEDTLQKVHAFGRSNRFTFEGDIAVRAQTSTQDAKELARLSSQKSTSEELPLPKLKLKPRPFQRVGVLYASRVKKCIIADEMGLGKTGEAIMTAAATKAYPLIVVCPASLRINWRREFDKWLYTKKLNIMTLNPTDIPYPTEKDGPDDVRKKVRRGVKKLKDADIIIVNYDKLRLYMEPWYGKPNILASLEPKGVIFDEAHYLKTSGAKRSRHAVALAHLPTVEVCLLLTGTPVMNDPKELIGQLRVIDRLKDFGGPTNFKNKYCFTKSSARDAAEAIDDEDIQKKMSRKMYAKFHAAQIELHENLRSLCYVRREKKDVWEDMPEKTRQTIYVPITNRSEYQAAEDDVVSYLTAKAVKDENFIASIKKLSLEARTSAIAERRADVEMISARAEILRRIGVCKELAAIGKLKAVTEWIGNFMESGEKLVIFAHHKSIQRELIQRCEEMGDEEGFKVVHLFGGDSPTARQKAVDAFQNDKKVKIIILSIKAGSEGLTLTAASNVLTIELGWNAATHDQAEDRLHRIGQKYPVSAYYLVAAKTIETRIAALIEQKRLVSSSVIAGDPMAGESSGSILGDLLIDLTRDIRL